MGLSESSTAQSIVRSIFLDNLIFVDAGFMLRIDEVDPVIVNGKGVKADIGKRHFEQQNASRVEHLEFEAKIQLQLKRDKSGGGCG